MDTCLRLQCVNVVLCFGLAFGGLMATAESLFAQQPIVVEAATHVRQPTAPLPAPEPLPPAPPERLLSLADLEHMAISANPAVIRASALVGAARGNLMQVGLPPNPTVGYDGQQLGSGGRAEQHGILFSQEIVRGGKLRLNRAVAEQEKPMVLCQVCVSRLVKTLQASARKPVAGPAGRNRGGAAGGDPAEALVTVLAHC